NLGIGQYRSSTFKKRIDESDWQNASIECKRWVYSRGKKLKGLVMRREVEATLLLKS
ncbi:lysozyme, partial [Candidatus Liberibacter brunswickensis]